MLIPVRPNESIRFYPDTFEKGIVFLSEKEYSDSRIVV
jgi:hypothetical protein